MWRRSSPPCHVLCALVLLLAAPFCESIFLGCTRLGVGLIGVVSGTLGIRCAACFSTQHQVLAAGHALHTGHRLFICSMLFPQMHALPFSQLFAHPWGLVPHIPGVRGGTGGCTVSEGRASPWAEGEAEGDTAAAGASANSRELWSRTGPSELPRIEARGLSAHKGWGINVCSHAWSGGAPASLPGCPRSPSHSTPTPLSLCGLWLLLTVPEPLSPLLQSGQ